MQHSGLAGAGRTKPKRPWWIGLVAILLLIGAGAAYLRWPTASDSGEHPAPVIPVTTTTVASADVPIELEALGRVTAFNTVTVRTLVAGPIKSIAFKDGQAVRQGDPLFQIDPRSLQASVDQDKAAVERDRAALANAEADLRRYQPLAGNGVVSTQQVETQRSQVSQLHATVAAGLAALDRDQVQLGYTTITAPITGVLGFRLVDVGNVVSPSDQNGLVVLTQVQPIEVLFALPQANLTNVQAQQAASGGKGLAVQAWTQDGSRQLDQGTLAALSNQVDAASGTISLKALFPNPRQSLWPGASVTVRLVLETQPDGLTIPLTAMDQGPAGPFVWLVAADNTTRPVQIQVRQQIRGQALVSSGLKAGDQVVTDGQYGLTSGAHVAVQQPSSQPAARGTSAPPLHTNQPGRLGISP